MDWRHTELQNFGMWQQVTGREEEPTEAGHGADMCPFFRNSWEGIGGM